MEQPGSSFLKWFFNEIPRDDVKTRLFLIVTFLIGLAGFSGVFINILLDLDFKLVIYCGTLALISLYFYFAVRKRKIATAPQAGLLAITCVVILSLFWPLNAGFSGPILCFFLGVPVYLAYFFSRRQYYVVLVSIFSIVCLNLIFYYFNPQYIIPYNNPLTQLIDVLLSFLLAGLLIGESAMFYAEENNRVRNEIEEKNKLINLQYLGLKELDDYKNNVFATLGHDLRGPINNAKSVFDLLMDESISKDVKEEIIRQSTHQIDEASILVENILLWARSQLGGVNVVKEHFKLSHCVNPLIESARILSKGKQVFIQYSDDNQFFVYGDKSILCIVLRNVINNAIKFSNPGSVVTIFASKGIGHSIIVTIKDEGVGISQENLQKIFEGGFSTQGTKYEMGSGLGLKLSKLFSELNNGSISIKSELGKGTQINIQIPEGHPY